MVHERPAAGRSHEDALRGRDGPGNVVAGTKECCFGEDVFKDLHVLALEPCGLCNGFCADASGAGGGIDLPLTRKGVRQDWGAEIFGVSETAAR